MGGGVGEIFVGVVGDIRQQKRKYLDLVPGISNDI